MSLWEAIVLGVVQGATEFLPVSSSGHLVIAQALMGLEIPGIFFEVAVHLATLLSVLVAYRDRVRRLLRGAARRERDAWAYLGRLVAATIPAAVIGVFLRDEVEALFNSPVVPGVALLVTGGLLWSTRAARRSRSGEAWHPPGLREAVLMGVAQAFALIPGISRSGATVVMALWLGVEAREAAAFSFLMAVPAIGGAAVLSIPELLERAPGVSTAALLWGSAAAAVTGVLAIRTFVAMLRKRSFHTFGLYCWVVGLGFLLYLYVR